MNNKGQTLVVFVVLLPVVLILFAYVFDTCYITMENKRLNDIASSSVKYLVVDNKSVSDVESIIYKNDLDIEVVSILDNNVHLKKDIEPIFGRIIGFNKYYLETNIIGTLVNGKLVLEEKGN